MLDIDQKGFITQFELKLGLCHFGLNINDIF